MRRISGAHFNMFKSNLFFLLILSGCNKNLQSLGGKKRNTPTMSINSPAALSLGAFGTIDKEYPISLSGSCDLPDETLLYITVSKSDGSNPVTLNASDTEETHLFDSFCRNNFFEFTIYASTLMQFGGDGNYKLEMKGCSSPTNCISAGFEFTVYDGDSCITETTWQDPVNPPANSCVTTNQYTGIKRSGCAHPEHNGIFNANVTAAPFVCNCPFPNPNPIVNSYTNTGCNSGQCVVNYNYTTVNSVDTSTGACNYNSTTADAYYNSYANGAVMPTGETCSCN